MGVARLALVAVLLASLAVPVTAELCTIDAVPAATILVPYFEVDLRNAGKGKFERTKITLVNTQAAPTIAHVVLWTDLSVPTFNFDIFLTGYDVQEFDVDALFVPPFQVPVPPIPSDAGFDTSECTVCNDEDGCFNFSPVGDPPFTPFDLINAHTGNPVEFHDGQCLARPSGRVARGYITIDAANACSRLYQFDGGYFENGGTGVASNNNTLHATITTYSKKLLREVPAIHIEAGTSNGLSTDGNFTFYGRYRGFDASDNRECGSVLWLMPFRKRQKFKTEAIVWRDSGANQGPFDCSELPEWYPLNQTQVVAFDQEENARQLGQDDFLFPAESQLVSVGKNPVNTGSFDAGWLFMNLDTSVPSVSDQQFGHGYVIARQRYRSREGEAWAEWTYAGEGSEPTTICGEPVSAALRATAQRARDRSSDGPKKRKLGEAGDRPRTRRPD